jgi:hypothetical protein
MYTLIAYKPESDDYYKGSLIQHYPSDFVYDHNLDEERLIKRLTTLHLLNLNLGDGEEGYGELVL